MPLLYAIPILAYLNLEETKQFYCNLGFEYHSSWEGYLIFSKDQIQLHFWKCTDEQIPKNTGCYINVNEIETFYETCKNLDILHPHGQLELKPWEMLQFSIVDNSGNIIHFGQDS